MAIASITAWLNTPNPNYTHGRLLYEQYGDDRLVLAIIKSGSGSYHFTKLHAAMVKLNERKDLEPKRITYTPPAQDEPLQSQFNVTSKPKVKTDLDDAPPEIRQIRNLKNEKFAEARHLLVVARVSDSKEHRLEAALKILDNMDYVNESWLVMDTWRETGKILEMKKEQATVSVADLSTQELLQKDKNLPSYICKARGRYNEQTDPRRKTKALAKVQELLNLQSAIKRRLDELV